MSREQDPYDWLVGPVVGFLILGPFLWLCNGGCQPKPVDSNGKEIPVHYAEPAPPKPCSEAWLDDRASSCRWGTLTRAGEMSCMAKLQMDIVQLCGGPGR